MPSLLFDGVYRGISTAEHESRFSVHDLRFYLDGRMVGVHTYHTYPTDVARWLTYESKRLF